MVNDDLYYIDKKFKLHDNDEIRIQFNAIDLDKETKIQFVGYDPTTFYKSDEVAEKVFDEEITHEDINIE